MSKVMICREMLQHKRAFYILKKAIFEKAIHAYAESLPKYPEFEYNRPESYLLQELKEKFLSFLNNSSRRVLYADAWDIFIAECDHDPEKMATFQWIMEEIFEMVLAGRWPAREVGHPPGSLWKEPRTQEGNYGGFHGRSFKKYIQKAGD